MRHRARYRCVSFERHHHAGWRELINDVALLELQPSQNHATVDITFSSAAKLKAIAILCNPFGNSGAITRSLVENDQAQRMRFADEVVARTLVRTQSFAVDLLIAQIARGAISLPRDRVQRKSKVRLRTDQLGACRLLPPKLASEVTARVIR